MAKLLSTTLLRRAINPWLLLWLIALGALATLLVLLTIAIDSSQTPSQDLTVLNWVVDRDFPLSGFFTVILPALTGNFGFLGLAIAIVAFLWLVGMNRAALGFAAVSVVMGIVAIGSDLTLGEIVGRSRPLVESAENSFPSGHAFASTLIFGFLGFLAVYYRVKRSVLIPGLGLLFTLILAVGFGRIFEQAHWPSDIAAGYLLGGFWLLLFIPLFIYLQRLSWLSSPKQAEHLEALKCDTCRIESSIASTVVLDPERGTATKIYKPPGLVRLLYWLAFQARFPYEHNRAALDASVYRRKIASALTIHRFGKDLVAQVKAVNCMYWGCDFVTEFIPGEKVKNDEEVKQFLGQVVETFSEAGLSVWQVNPRNPHAHTNVIRTPSGDSIIIDLESAVVTPIPAPGQWRSALRRGSIPVFDDIDFERLRRYIAANEAALEASLGPERLAEFKDDVNRGEQAVRTWHQTEPRIWGRLIRGVYRLFDWKRFFMRLSHALNGADQAAQNFLARGIERWETEGRLPPSEAASLRAQLSSDERRNALHHMGVHMILSVVLFVPIPGLRSAARFSWTFAFWVKAIFARIFRRRAWKAAGKPANIHSPLVMVLALVPMLGGIAYGASRPLRNKLTIRLILDQIATKMPFRLHTRMRLHSILAPSPSKAKL